MREAARMVAIPKPVSPHVLHSSSPRTIETGDDIRTVQELLGHKDVATTQIDAHVLNRGAGGVLIAPDRTPGPASRTSLVSPAGAC